MAAFRVGRAVLRAKKYGYGGQRWRRDGIGGWRQAGLPRGAVGGESARWIAMGIRRSARGGPAQGLDDAARRSGAGNRSALAAQQASRRVVAACSPQSCSPCENRGVTPDGHTCPIDFKAAETVDYKSSLSKAP